VYYYYYIPAKKIPLSAAQKRDRDSDKRARREECQVQTLLNSETPKDAISDLLEQTWVDSRREHDLRKACIALLAACMNHTLVGSAKEIDKYVKVPDALRNRGELVLDKKHTYRRMILTGDTPSWLQPVWCREDTNPDG
jgi:hypothetical protein